ncbi:hypothetical protein HDK77DRAFT_177881 [Phyllosticta capitalensis]
MRDVKAMVQEDLKSFHTQIEQDRQSHASSIKAIIDENATRLSTLHTALTTGLASLSGAPPENTPSVNKVVDSGGASNSSRTLGLGSLNGTFEHDVPGSRPRDSLEFVDTFEHDIPASRPRDSLKFIDTFEYDISASRSSFNDTSGSESSPSTTFPAHKFHTSGAFVDDVPASRSYTSREAKSTSILGKLNKTQTVSLLSRDDSQTHFQVLVTSSTICPSSSKRSAPVPMSPRRRRTVSSLPTSHRPGSAVALSWPSQLKSASTLVVSRHPRTCQQGPPVALVRKRKPSPPTLGASSACSSPLRTLKNLKASRKRAPITSS